MYRLFYTPTWFNGWDIIFEAFILIIALMIAGYSWRIYKLNKENPRVKVRQELIFKLASAFAEEEIGKIKKKIEA